MAPVLVTLNDLEGHSQGHSPFAGLFKCNPSNILQYFTRFQLAASSCGPSATAGILVTNKYAENKLSIQICMIVKTQFAGEDYAKKLSSTLLSNVFGSGISNLVG